MKSIFQCIEENDVSSFKEMIKSYPQLINLKIDGGRLQGCDLLVYCARYGFTEIAIILLEKGLSPNSSLNYYGAHSSLSIALMEGHENMVKLLLKNNANPDDIVGPWQLSCRAYERILREQGKWKLCLLS